MNVRGRVGQVCLTPVPVISVATGAHVRKRLKADPLQCGHDRGHGMLSEDRVVSIIYLSQFSDRRIYDIV